MLHWQSSLQGPWSGRRRVSPVSHGGDCRAPRTQASTEEECKCICSDGWTEALEMQQNKTDSYQQQYVSRACTEPDLH